MLVLPFFSELIVFLKVYVLNLSLLGMSWIFLVTHQRWVPQVVMNLILAYSGRDFALSILILLSIHSRGVGAVSLRAGTTGTSGTTHHDGNSELASVCRQPLTPADLRQVTNWSSDRRTEDW